MHGVTVIDFFLLYDACWVMILATQVLNEECLFGDGKLKELRDEAATLRI